ncbi:hypothetical protein [Paenibacillus sp. UNC451MF]|uniref:hypothetical protein n=1 Tax=Paenibacillus sp. UNC451MF TaxID=1449063 RepID=UPI000491AF77|nr:hypothetical protein [Paenibacillus sp. UNC451MF]
MRKRLIWLIVGCLCVGLISYGAFGLSDRSVSAEISKETKGQFVRMDDGGKRLVVNVGGQEASYTVSSTVWVYRDMQKSAMSDLQAGDAVDVILNSKDQAAYIKATSAQGAANSGQEETSTPEASASSDSSAPGSSTNSADAGTSASTATEASNPATSSPAPAILQGSSSAAANVSANQGSSAGTSKPPASNGKPGTSGITASKAWEKLSFEWKSREFELKVKQEPAKQGSKEKGKSEIFLQTKDRSSIHLDGAEADSFIQQLVKGLPSDSKAFEASLKQKIASEFQLANTSPEWKLDVKWPEKAANVSRPQESKVKGYEKDKEQETQKNPGKGKEKEKHQDKGHGNDDD